MKKTLLTGLLAATALTAAGAAEAKKPSQEEMWQLIQQQQAQIEALTKKLEETDEKVEATAAIAEGSSVGGHGGHGHGHGGHGAWYKKTSLHGYGELHYNGGVNDGDDEIDFHRFIVGISHSFTDKLRLISELEFEHADTGSNGALELEQAYVEYDITDTTQVRGGLFLLPIGILNETHEPTTFFGVERNPIEVNLIPTDFREAGVGVNGVFGEGFRYDLAAHSGLQVNTANFNIRSGRQQASEADADRGAVTGRLKWTGVPGVELAASLQYQQDITANDAPEDAAATLFSTHAAIEKNGFGLRALYARWDIDSSQADALGADEQFGFYIEPSYTFDLNDHGSKLGFFGRYNQFDLTEGSAADTEVTQTDLGVNFWPHDNVVLKADVAFIDNPSGTDDDEVFNLGIGYTF